VARRRLKVLHWVVCLESQVVPPAAPNNFYNLLRVGYWHTAPASTEFPWSVVRLDFFVRFVNGIDVGEFEVRVDWLDAPEGSREMQTYGPFRVAFRPGEPVRDTVFRCLGVPMDGPGRYCFTLIDLHSQRSRRLASEYISVVRLP
jgi:hypothetical protein